MTEKMSGYTQHTQNIGRRLVEVMGRVFPDRVDSLEEFMARISPGGQVVAGIDLRYHSGPARMEGFPPVFKITSTDRYNSDIFFRTTRGGGKTTVYVQKFQEISFDDGNLDQIRYRLAREAIEVLGGRLRTIRERHPSVSIRVRWIGGLDDFSQPVEDQLKEQYLSMCMSPEKSNKWRRNLAA